MRRVIEQVSTFHPLLWSVSLCVLCGNSSANPPTASYIFPAGGQRGTTVPVRVGGLFLHDQCEFTLSGRGVNAERTLTPAKRLWFEGPLLPIPESQAQEDYPADMIGRVTVAPDAPLGGRRGRVFTSQGGAGGLVFVVGELPEVIEKETDGDAIPQPIKLPVTANGRVFPREDIDLWEFDAEAGKTVTAFIHTAALNSPLVAQLDILDANGKVVAEPMLYPCVGTDASVKFTPKVAGKYRVRVIDARTLGGPAYVYRLTVTTANVPEFDFPLKAKPDGLKDITEPDASKTLQPPIAVNGQIERPGIVGAWKVELKKGTKYTFDLQAQRFGSPLRGVAKILDATGKELAKAEATETADPQPFAFTAPADGTYTLMVSEKFRGRAGANFIYRLRVLDGTEKVEPGFRLTVASDTFTIQRGSTLKVKVTAERFGGFTGPIEIKIDGLPEGIEAKSLTLGVNQTAIDFPVTVGPKALLAAHALPIQGVAIIDDMVRAVSAVFPGTRLIPDEAALRLAVALPTPFKIIDQYVMTSAPRGEVYRRKYKVERGGFDGPIAIQLADKQARHLQGVIGPVITLKPGETEFEYPAFLPPWMELGRTCRVCVMTTAKVKDGVDGREHTVSYSSTEQNQQMIVVVGPGRLGMSLDKTSIRAEGEMRMTVRVSRAKSLSGSAKVEVVLPEHWKGVIAAPLVIPADAEAGELVLTFAKDCGSFNAPLIVRATVETKETPVTAEAKVEVVASTP